MNPHWRDRLREAAGQKDPTIVLLRSLQTADGRSRSGLFFVEGEEIVRRAFEYGGDITSVILSDKSASSPASDAIGAMAANTDVDLCLATHGLLRKVLDARPTPDCLAIVERRTVSLDQSLAGPSQLVMMIENGENADNLGMLLRSTDAAGVTGVILAGDTTDPFSRRVVRGSRGAVFTVPICIEPDSSRALEEAASRGMRVVATSANADVSYTDIDYAGPTMIVVGNEHTGISADVRERADAVVRIPMLGKINSLNIAVAASIMLYEAVRQRA